MKSSKQIIKRIVLLIAVLLSVIQGLKAQSNLTTLLEINDSDLLEDFSATGGGNQIFSSVINGLQNETIKGDCFLITMELSSSDFPISTTNEVPVLKFVINNKLIYEIGVKMSKTWYIKRPLDVAGYPNASPLVYETYDLDKIEGTFTFIIGHNFTAIACDDDVVSSKFIMAPFYFGMDSNLDDRQINGGEFQSHMGEFTGSNVQFPNSKYVFGHRGFKVYRMSGILYPRGDGSDFYDINAWEQNKYSMDRLVRFLNNKKDNTITNRMAENESNKDLDTSNLKTYPNPSDGLFSIDFFLKEEGLVNFKVFDLAGKQLFEQNDKPFAQGQNIYKFSEESKLKLTAGVYLLQVSSSEFSKTITLLIE